MENNTLEAFFKKTLDKLEKDPNLILEVEYDRMIEFFTVLYRQDKKELCKKLILIACDKYGSKALADFSKAMMNLFKDEGKIEVSDVKFDDCVEITIDEFKILDNPKFIGRTVGSDDYYHSIWEYNGIYSKIKVKK